MRKVKPKGDFSLSEFLLVTAAEESCLTSF